MKGKITSCLSPVEKRLVLPKQNFNIFKILVNFICCSYRRQHRAYKQCTTDDTPQRYCARIQAINLIYEINRFEECWVNMTGDAMPTTTNKMQMKLPNKCFFALDAYIYQCLHCRVKNMTPRVISSSFFRKLLPRKKSNGYNTKQTNQATLTK